MVFYIPDCEEKDILKSLIEKHGGLITELHECFTYQLHPLKQGMNQSDFFKGDVYKATWITDSVKANELLDKDDFYYRTYSDLESNKSKHFEMFKMCAYTLTEAFKINEIA